MPPKKWWKKTSIWHREYDNNEPTNENRDTPILQFWWQWRYFDIIADIINNLLKMLKNKFKNKTLCNKNHCYNWS